MALPKLTVPEFKTTIPSTGETIKYRPFLVKEEKLLYMALESKDSDDIMDAIKNILRSCVLTPGFDVEKLTTYDFEFLFLALRSKSVGETVEVLLLHQNPEFKSKCNHATKVLVDLNNIQVKKTEGRSNKIIFEGSDIGVVLKDPVASRIPTNSDDQVETLIRLIYNCCDVIFDKDTTYEKFTFEEFKEFIDSLSKKQFAQLVEFMNTIPKVSFEVQFTCDECGETEQVVLEGLQSFFT